MGLSGSVAIKRHAYECTIFEGTLRRIMNTDCIIYLKINALTSLVETFQNSTKHIAIWRIPFDEIPQVIVSDAFPDNVYLLATVG